MYLGEEFKFKPSTELIEEELLLIEMPLFAKSRAYQCAYGYSGSRPYKLADCLAGSLLSMRQHILHCDSRGFKHWFDTWFVPLLMQGRIVLVHEPPSKPFVPLIQRTAQGQWQAVEYEPAAYPIIAMFSKPAAWAKAAEDAGVKPHSGQKRSVSGQAMAGKLQGSVLNKYVQQSPIDFDHVLKADYTKKGKPTGGHTLLYGDVRIISGTESVLDAAGVYKATIQVPDPKNLGQWITKTRNNSTNTMFPKDWDEIRVKTEVDAAWNDPNKIVQGDKWISITPSGVKVEGWIAPKTTVYPVYQTPKKP